MTKKPRCAQAPGRRFSGMFNVAASCLKSPRITLVSHHNLDELKKQGDKFCTSYPSRPSARWQGLSAMPLYSLVRRYDCCVQPKLAVPSSSFARPRAAQPGGSFRRLQWGRATHEASSRATATESHLHLRMETRSAIGAVDLPGLCLHSSFQPVRRASLARH